MKRRSSGSADDGDESSLDSDIPDPDPNSQACPSGLSSRPSSARSRRPSSLNWKQSNGRNGRSGRDDPISTTTLSRTSLAAPSTPNMALSRTPPQSPSPTRRFRRSPVSILVVLVSALGIALLFSILRSLVTKQLDPKGCRMSYMRPSYVRFTEFDTEHTRFATKYSLYLYREQGVDEEDKLRGIPVLFIPGNAGSYKQVRPIAAEAANYFHHNLEHDSAALDAGVRGLDFFTVDFNEDITAFHGQTLLDQAEYLNEAVRYILSLYSDPQRKTRDGHLPDPTSVIVLGHSMGGVVARAMLVQTNYQSNSINTIITMSAPHARPPVTFDGQIVQLYDQINDYWRHAYSQQWANNNPLWHVTLVSIAGGGLDTVVPSDYTSLESLVPPTHGFTVFTTGIPTVWTSMDHQAILWCDQFRKVVARTLYDIVDVHRASQTKPRADRMRVFKKRFLTGMESTTERDIGLKEPTTLLTVDDGSNSILPAGKRLFLKSLGHQPLATAYLLPVPPQGSPGAKRFSLLTDAHLDEAGEGGKLEVLFCNVLSSHSGTSSTLYPFHIDLSVDKSGSTTRFACKNTASDLILLPASTSTTRFPFYLDREREVTPFSYLQYEMNQISDHQFVAIVDKAAGSTHNFIIAEFSDHTGFYKTHDISLARLLWTGASFELDANRPMSVEVNIPSLQSALFAYDLEIKESHCKVEHSAFRPLVRQFLDRPYESKYFVNAQEAAISLHGVAPYVPPPLDSRIEHGLTFQIWSDTSCNTSIHVNIKPDMWGSLGKLYMRYRTVFAAFPLLTVTLVLRKQFRVYDTTGIFISFSESLEMCLRQSIPLLLLSLTLLSASLSGSSLTGLGLLVNTGAAPASGIDFHQHDTLIGTEDPFFWFLVPLIGIVCIGVCTSLHYVVIVFTHFFGMFSNMALFLTSGAVEDQGHIRSPSFAPSTPRRRMITTAILLFLVWTFIPYQFAYLVACIVQLFTVVRALRINTVMSSTTNSNYYHYAHSILLLMLWILPINLPILAVWIRNLAVHWLTPFSSHHNVLSIMPFILLVENLTTGKMIPQLTSGLRHVTSVLLFGTALYAAIFGVSHAYMLHYLVNIIAVWLVVVHSTSVSWSLSGIGSMFDGNANESEKSGKAP